MPRKKRPLKSIPVEKVIRDCRKKRLSPAQAAFIAQYTSGKHPTLADTVLAAGYKAGTRKDASTMGTQLLSNPKIIDALSSVIHGQKFNEEIVKTFEEAFNLDGADYKEKVEALRVKDLYIKNLMKIKGLEAPKRIDKREITADLTGLLPERVDKKADPEESGE